MTDIVADIDAVLADERAANLQMAECATCRRSLCGDASYYWCSDTCQERWHSARSAGRAEDGGLAAEVPDWSPEEWSPHAQLGTAVLPPRRVRSPYPPVTHPGGEARATVSMSANHWDLCDDRAEAEVWNDLYAQLAVIADQHDLTLIRVTTFDELIDPLGVHLAMSAMIGPPRPEYLDGWSNSDLDEYAEYVRASWAWEEQFGVGGSRAQSYPPRRWISGTAG